MAGTSARYGSMDALRGLAILGILLVNVAGMGGSLKADERPPALGWSQIDQAVWWAQTIFVEGTMRGLLSLLFGAGFILLLHRLEREISGWQAMLIYYRRAVWLILFGIAHAYILLWPGDILLIYGLAALALYPMREWPVRRLIGAGLILTLAISAMMWGANLVGDSPFAQNVDYSAHAAQLKAFQAAERTARLGSYAENARFMSAIATQWTMTPMVLWWVADAFALMLIGAGLARWGVLQGRAPVRVYAVLMIGGYAIGLPLKAYLAEAAWSAGFMRDLVSTAGGYQISRVATTLGHAGAFLLLWTWASRRSRDGLAFRPLIWIGRLALTNYIGQTIIGQFILFSGFGFGLFGKFGWAGLALIAVCIWIVQIIFSGLYLRYFRIGPLELLWRQLSLSPLNRT